MSNRRGAAVPASCLCSTKRPNATDQNPRLKETVGVGGDAFIRLKPRYATLSPKSVRRLSVIRAFTDSQEIRSRCSGTGPCLAKFSGTMRHDNAALKLGRSRHEGAALTSPTKEVINSEGSVICSPCRRGVFTSTTPHSGAGLSRHGAGVGSHHFPGSSNGAA